MFQLVVNFPLDVNTHPTACVPAPDPSLQALAKVSLVSALVHVTETAKSRLENLNFRILLDPLRGMFSHMFWIYNTYIFSRNRTAVEEL